MGIFWLMGPLLSTETDLEPMTSLVVALPDQAVFSLLITDLHCHWSSLFCQGRFFLLFLFKGKMRLYESITGELILRLRHMIFMLTLISNIKIQQQILVQKNSSKLFTLLQQKEKSCTTPLQKMKVWRNINPLRNKKEFRGTVRISKVRKSLWSQLWKQWAVKGALIIENRESWTGFKVNEVCFEKKR